MAKKITEFKNPLTSTSGSVLDLNAWIGGVMWVVMFGIIVAMGTKVLSVVDSKVPGSQTPDMKPFAQPQTAGSGLTIY
jgi:hypothetical protein